MLAPEVFQELYAPETLEPWNPLESLNPLANGEQNERSSHRQCRENTAGQFQRVAGRHRRHGSGRHRHRGSDPAGRNRQKRSQRSHHGAGAALRLRPEPGQAGGRQGRDALGSGMHHRQQGVRLRAENRHAGRPGDPDRRCRRGGGRRHGEHEPGPLLPGKSAFRLPHGSRPTSGFHDPRRAVGHRQRFSHGHVQRTVLRALPREPGGPGPLCRRILSPGPGGRPSGRFDAEIVPVSIAQRKGEPKIFDRDECARETILRACPG
jgi:hypothetical protein